MDRRSYDFADVSQYQESASPDLFPDDRHQAEKLVEHLAFDATVWGLTAVLQYAQFSDFVWKRPAGDDERLNVFDHRRGLAGPDFAEFRVPNVDTLYSNGWISVEQGPVELEVPAVGDSYYTVNLFDAHGNASNISNRTHGGGPVTVVLCTSEQAAEARGTGKDVMVVATPVVWALLRVQVTATGGTGEADAMRKRFRIRTPHPQASLQRYTEVDSSLVESRWTEFATALTAVIGLCGVPAREEVMVARYRAIGIGAGPGEVSPSGCDWVPDVAQRGFDSAMDMIRASRSQLGEPLGSGWTRVRDKGRHGTNFLARAVMNNVGLGANVVEENTSFNTYVSSNGVPLDGSNGAYCLVMDTAPPVDYFWSVTLYLADSGRVYGNPWDRYSVGSASGLTPDGSGRVRIRIDPGAAERDPNPGVLPAPRSPFFLVLRTYGPTEELLEGRWSPGPVDTLEHCEETGR
ncbi:DUF1254 domain-containing protein [Dietzia sp. SYD-A1]|uniref:DUF1254 domain-containing protein n=1 Tax=Dietzia sp. SYD-A1 TaxID=2780141 RepID=UPI001891C29F|nr:DUF1254 domain-containing protein [Dietzia sp. SYD-A1]